MNTKIEKSEKTSGFTVKMQKSEKTIGFYMKNFQPLCKTGLFCKKLERERLVFSCPRIRAVTHTYSSGYVVRNPYRQAV